MRSVGIVALLLLCACGAETPPQLELVGTTMGTQFSVKLATGAGDFEAQYLQQRIEGKLAHIDDLMSTYATDSVISRFNSSKTTDWYPVLDEFCLAVESALEISDLTDGSFDITVGPLVNLWGFGPGDIIDRVPDSASIETLRDSVGFEYLQTDCAVPAIKKEIAELVLDMSAIGKGYAADRVADLLEELGFEDYLVEIGGEMRLHGSNALGEKWAIGIEGPSLNERRPHTIIRLSDTAVATSGDYRNYFEVDGTRYSHTIDSRTGKPVTHSLASVTVVDKLGSRADALATALLVMGPIDGMELATREGMAALFLLRTNGGIEERSTPAFQELRST
jgi:thiamine biosynthesis lipoprotein